MKDIEKDCYCKECLQFKEAKEFERHYLIKPLPKKKICNSCIEKHDSPLDRVNRASVSMSRSNRRNNSKSDHSVVERRRAIEDYNDQKQLKDEFEL